MLQGQPDFPLKEVMRATSVSAIAWGIACLSLGLFLLLAYRQKASRHIAHRGLVLAALVLVMGPPALIAISAKYQAQLTWGSAHIPVYYQYFGVAFLAATGVEYLLRSRWSNGVFILAPVFAVFMGANWIMNMRQSAYFDGAFAEPRNSLVSALKHGLFDRVQDGDVVEIVGQPVFINGNLIYQTIQKNVHIPDEGAIQGWFDSKPRPSAQYYRLYRKPAFPYNWRLKDVPATPTE